MRSFLLGLSGKSVLAHLKAMPALCWSLAPTKTDARIRALPSKSDRPVQLRDIREIVA
jgi:hypothetical protein